MLGLEVTLPTMPDYLFSEQPLWLSFVCVLVVQLLVNAQLSNLGKRRQYSI